MAINPNNKIYKIIERVTKLDKDIKDFYINNTYIYISTSSLRALHMDDDDNNKNLMCYVMYNKDKNVIAYYIIYDNASYRYGSIYSDDKINHYIMSLFEMNIGVTDGDGTGYFTNVQESSIFESVEFI